MMTQDRTGMKSGEQASFIQLLLVLQKSVFHINIKYDNIVKILNICIYENLFENLENVYKIRKP